jgi:cellobiose-specific phosphotransferase system component IIA
MYIYVHIHLYKGEAKRKAIEALAKSTYMYICIYIYVYEGEAKKKVIEALAKSKREKASTKMETEAAAGVFTTP